MDIFGGKLESFVYLWTGWWVIMPPKAQQPVRYAQMPHGYEIVNIDKTKQPFKI